MSEYRKYLVVYDTETTGLSPQNDFIIQLSAVKIDKSTFEVVAEFNEYIIPQHAYTITPEAQAVHGISKEFLEANGQPLAMVAQHFIDMCADADLCGYNSNRFDILFCYKDFQLAGFEFPIDNRMHYDACLMEHRLNPRDLGSTYKKYTGRTMEEAGLDAHNSLSDVKATIEVFKHQLKLHNLTYPVIDEWDENHMICPDGSIRNIAKPGEPRKLAFRNGKYKDQDVYVIAKQDPGYMKWAVSKMFSPYTTKMCREYFKECESRAKQK